MVSIIIPIYNCEYYISKCLDSILNQNEKSIEVIAVDDGSKDNSALIIDEYSVQDSRIKALHIENSGPSRARNIGLNHATGDWILFVDADDWIDADILSRLELNNNSPDIIFFGFKKHYEDGRCEECIPIGIGNDASVCQQLKNLLNSKDELFGYSVNKVYRRSIIENNNIRFKEGLNIREDEIFALNYCQYVSSVKIISFAPYNYRILNTSLSHNTNRQFKNYRLLINLERKILASYPSSEFKFSFCNKIYHYYISSIIECIRLNKQEKKDVINEAVAYYDMFVNCILATKWQKMIFGLSLKSMRKSIIYSVFKLRSFLSIHST